MTKVKLLLLTAIICISCSIEKPVDKLKREIADVLSKQKGTFSVAFRDLSSDDQILINEHEQFHAASTMKTPVMIEVFKQVADKRISLEDSIVIKNEFKSIVDGSTYSLSPDDDSEQDLYKQLGKKKSLKDLVYDMIIVSSNLATNLVIDKVDAKNVMRTLREDVGVKEIEVLRGVEDSKAYKKGLNNTVTAYDLLVIFEKIGREQMVSADASRDMIQILLDQRFNDIIPAKLPREVKVAHKTGWINGLHHDGGIILLPDGRKYVLVLLSKKLEDEKASVDAMATVSELIYRYVVSKK